MHKHSEAPILTNVEKLIEYAKSRPRSVRDEAEQRLADECRQRLDHFAPRRELGTFHQTGVRVLGQRRWAPTKEPNMLDFAAWSNILATTI